MNCAESSRDKLREVGTLPILIAVLSTREEEVQCKVLFTLRNMLSDGMCCNVCEADVVAEKNVMAAVECHGIETLMQQLSSTNELILVQVLSILSTIVMYGKYSSLNVTCVQLLILYLLKQ
jgi:hypothetical protein